MCSRCKYQHSELTSSPLFQVTATEIGSVADMTMTTSGNADGPKGNRNIPVEADRNSAEEGSWDRHS